MSRVDKRERDEGSSVLRPAGQRGQSIEPHVRAEPLGHWPNRDASRPHFQELEPDITCAPQLGRRGRHDRLDQFHHASYQAERALAERHLGTFRRAKQIGDETEIRSFDVGEEQRGATASYDASMDLCDFKVRIDLRLHRDEVIVTAQPIEKRAEVGE